MGTSQSFDHFLYRRFQIRLWSSLLLRVEIDGEAGYQKGLEKQEEVQFYSPSLLPLTYPATFSYRLLNTCIAYPVTLMTLSGGPYSQFILQARTLGNQDVLAPNRIGKFVKPLPDETEFLACDENNPQSVVTHSMENSSNSDQSFIWKSPKSNEGTFEFQATIVAGREYWESIKSTAINFRMFPPDLSDCGKSVGCFVHKVKTEECFEGGCKIVVKTDVTDDGKIATIIMGRRTPSRGYVGLAFSDDKDKMEDIILMACVKNDDAVKVKAYFLKDRYSGFINISSYRISSVKHEVYDKMMWCKFQFQVATLTSTDKDLKRPRYQLYMSGSLDEKNFPLLPEDNILASENSMHLNATKYYNIVKYATDGASSILVKAMSGVKLDIIWSPIHNDRFLTVGTEISLYQIEEIKSSVQKPSSVNISETEHASVLCVNSDFSYLKCVAWYPKVTTDLLLAVGLASGKVVITSLGDCSPDSQRFVGREFAVKQARQCNAISWNHTEFNLLACGLEKHRSENSVLVWDINRPPVYNSSVSGNASHHTASQFPALNQSRISAGSDINSLARSQTLPTSYNNLYQDYAVSNKPVAELGTSETAHSLQWFLHQPKTLVVGMSSKTLKIFDLRDKSKHHNACSTKAVYGVCVDPYFEHRLASYVDNQVVIWDIRNFEKSILTLTDSRQISKLSWCPTRCNLLSSLAKDSSVVNLYDIQSLHNNQEETEPAVIERNIQSQNQAVVLSFSWHPVQENRMLTISPAGNICNFTVSDRIHLTWSPSSHLAWSNGTELFFEIEKNSCVQVVDDISYVMKRRALHGYSISNAELTNDEQLINMWKWFKDIL
ncbi:GATOR complex protein MIOS [Nymphon striatum]|nr:GATOR complex protein MIOS [Nymphon striatum]